MSITLRPMTDADIPGIVDWMLTMPLWGRYGFQRETSAASFRQGIARGEVLIVADDGSEACGFAWCILDGMIGAYPYLKLISVHPQKHGQNIGGLLLDEIERIAAERGHEKLFLLVSDFNTAAQRFYRKHGYQQIGAIPGLVLPDVAELIYWKDYLLTR